MSRQDAGRLIDEILSKKPPVISPTLPPLNVGLDSLRTDPLDLDAFSVGPINRSSPAKEKIIKPQPTGGRNAPKASARKRPPGPTTVASPRTPKVSMNSKVRGYLNLMAEIHKKEQYADTIEEWRNLIKSIEMTGTIESAKSPRNTELLAMCSWIHAWIAEHLMALVLKRISTRLVAETLDASFVLAQIALVTALREAGRQSQRRALHFSPNCLSDIGCISFLSLDEFVEKLSK